MITNQMYVKHISFIYYVTLATGFDPYRIIFRPLIESSLSNTAYITGTLINVNWDPNNVRSVLMT